MFHQRDLQVPIPVLGFDSCSWDNPVTEIPVSTHGTGVCLSIKHDADHPAPACAGNRDDVPGRRPNAISHIIIVTAIAGIKVKTPYILSTILIRRFGAVVDSSFGIWIEQACFFPDHNHIVENTAGEEHIVELPPCGVSEQERGLEDTELALETTEAALHIFAKPEDALVVANFLGEHRIATERGLQATPLVVAPIADEIHAPKSEGVPRCIEQCKTDSFINTITVDTLYEVIKPNGSLVIVSARETCCSSQDSAFIVACDLQHTRGEKPISIYNYSYLATSKVTVGKPSLPTNKLRSW